jgi:hypothetical protein
MLIHTFIVTYTTNVANEKTKIWLLPGLIIFFIYVFAAAQPIPEETILVPRWLTSLESNYPVNLGGNPSEKDAPLPFQIGERFGYIEDDGSFIINRLRQGSVSLSAGNWAEYEAIPSSIQVMNPRSEPVMEIENPGGYPVFLDGRVFIVGREQNSISALDSRGEVLWTYDFPAPLTCIDGAGGFFLAGTLDGTVELLNSSGRQVFPPFEPGGSRLSVILGCAVSRDASRLALVSGIDDQRFLLLEQSGESYRVVYHEFLTDGFRRAVHIAFIDGGAKIAYEREGGLGIYDIASRTSVNLPVEGEIAALDESGADGVLFVITSLGPTAKRLVTIQLPGTIVMNAPFKSGNVFLGRRDNRLYVGGDLSMASFELSKK